uniref:UPAR/Ly6 domain-containing protein n=1 Tax=Strongyloides stercoralis TaxID=6248 RepID=A0A0K0EKM8_STRER
MKFLAPLLFYFIFSIKIYTQASSNFNNVPQEVIDAAIAEGKVLCHNCNMPEQCNSGGCVGDYCVKAIVDGRYVTKGCENRTSIKNSPVPSTYPGGVDTLTLKSILKGNNYSKEITYQDSLKLGCKSTEIFKVPQTTCYCNDRFYCNSSSKLHSLTSILITIPFIIISIIIFNPNINENLF